MIPGALLKTKRCTKPGGSCLGKTIEVSEQTSGTEVLEFINIPGYSDCGFEK
jgi:hypothetical protein